MQVPSGHLIKHKILKNVQCQISLLKWDEIPREIGISETAHTGLHKMYKRLKTCILKKHFLSQTMDRDGNETSLLRTLPESFPEESQKKKKKKNH